MKTISSPGVLVCLLEAWSRLQLFKIAGEREIHWCPWGESLCNGYSADFSRFCISP